MNTISIQRIIKLFSNYITENKKRDMTIAGILFFIAFISGFFYSNSFKEGDIVTFSGYRYNIGLFFFLCLMILASKIYSPLKNSFSRISYLMIPASTLEKTIANLFIVHLFQLIVFFGFVLLGLLVGNGICYLLAPYKEFLFISFHHETLIFSFIFSEFNCSFFRHIILFQSIMFFGSLFFKYNAFLKTTLTLFLFFCFIAIIDAFIGASIAWNTITENAASITINFKKTELYSFLNQYKTFIDIVICCVLISAFWTMSFFKLRETEV